MFDLTNEINILLKENDEQLWQFEEFYQMNNIFDELWWIINRNYD